MPWCQEHQLNHIQGCLGGHPLTPQGSHAAAGPGWRSLPPWVLHTFHMVLPLHATTFSTKISQGSIWLVEPKSLACLCTRYKGCWESELLASASRGGVELSDGESPKRAMYGHLCLGSPALGVQQFLIKASFWFIGPINSESDDCLLGQQDRGSDVAILSSSREPTERIAAPSLPEGSAVQIFSGPGLPVPSPVLWALPLVTIHSSTARDFLPSTVPKDRRFALKLDLGLTPN